MSDLVDRDPEDALLGAAASLMEARDGEQLEAAFRLAKLVPQAYGLEATSEARRLYELKLPGGGQRRLDPDAYSRLTEEAREEATELLRNLAAKESVAPPAEQRRIIRPELARLTVDPDLWVYIGTLVMNDDWQHVASAACRFLEDRLREWAGVGSEVDGPALATQLFGQGAPLALGDNEGQRQGWEQLVRGLLMGPRNAVQHGIDARQSTDLRCFASGIVGTVTLILAELRARHPQQFRRNDT